MHTPTENLLTPHSCLDYVVRGSRALVINEKRENIALDVLPLILSFMYAYYRFNKSLPLSVRRYFCRGCLGCSG